MIPEGVPDDRPGLRCHRSGRSDTASVRQILAGIQSTQHTQVIRVISRKFLTRAENKRIDRADLPSQRIDPPAAFFKKRKGIGFVRDRYTQTDDVQRISKSNLIDKTLE